MPNGLSKFNFAVAEGKLSKVLDWLDAGGDINVKLNRGATPLFVAVLYRHFEVVKALLQRGPLVDMPMDDGYTPLYAAVLTEQLEVVQALLQCGASVNVLTNEGYTPLYTAAKMGQEEVVKVLLSKGANPNAAGLAGITPLMTAVAKGNLSMVNILLAAGANPKAKANDGLVPLSIAMHQGHEEIIKVLLPLMFESKSEDKMAPSSSAPVPSCSTDTLPESGQIPASPMTSPSRERYSLWYFIPSDPSVFPNDQPVLLIDEGAEGRPTFPPLLIPPMSPLS